MEQSVIESLKQFGLTDYEAKTYLALCMHEEASPKEITKISGVPRTKVYEVLTSLSNKGWIKIVKTSPLTYKVEDLKKITEKLKQKEENMKKAKEEIIKFIKPYYETKAKEISPEGGQELIIGENESVKTLSKFILSAKSEIKLIHTSPELLERLFPYFRKALIKNVDVKILLCARKKYPIRKIKKLFKVKRDTEVEEASHGSLVIDGEYVINIFEKPKLSIVVLYYKRCVLCLNAWLNKVWELGKEI